MRKPQAPYVCCITWKMTGHDWTWTVCALYNLKHSACFTRHQSYKSLGLESGGLNNRFRLLSFALIQQARLIQLGFLCPSSSANSCHNSILQGGKSKISWIRAQPTLEVLLPRDRGLHRRGAGCRVTQWHHPPAGRPHPNAAERHQLLKIIMEDLIPADLSSPGEATPPKIS